MNAIKAIRKRLGLTQTEFAEVLGCTQGNIGHYERGRAFQIDRAGRLIEYAEGRGLRLSLDQIYGREALPESAPEPPQITTPTCTGPDRRAKPRA